MFTIEIELLSVFGFYWHLLLEVATVLRSAEIDHAAENFQVKKSFLYRPGQPNLDFQKMNVLAM